jgi:transposase
MRRDDLGDVSGLTDGQSGGRRRWSLSAKRQIVLESQAGSGSIAATARRHGISRSQLMAWRRAFLVEAATPAPVFMPIRVRPQDEAESGPALPAADTAAVLAKPDSVVPGATVPGMMVPALSSIPPAFGRVEIVLVCGRRLVLDGAIDADAVLGLARGLERLS